MGYATAQASSAIDMTLQAAGWRGSPGGAVPSPGLATAHWVASWFSLFTFALATPLGLLVTYFTLSSVLRCLASAAGEPMGDPALTLIDSAWQRQRDRRATRRTRAARERLEGTEEPDLLVPGASLGHPAADFVVVSARRKPDWEAGVTVITGSGWFQVGSPIERSTSRGLRTLYPLTSVRGEVVLRRRVPYELPPVTSLPSARS